MIKWDLAKDLFDYGQWIYGHIFPKHCDISPDGKYFIYAIYKPVNIEGIGYEGLTAISKPPYFTALGMWPFNSTCFVGGFFESEHKVNVCSKEMEVIKYKPPLEIAYGCSKLLELGHVISNSDFHRHENGWNQLEKFQWENSGFMGTHVWQKVGKKYTLTERLDAREHFNNKLGVDQLDYTVSNRDGTPLFTIKKADWADFYKNRDLLFAKDGCLYRLNNNDFEKFALEGLNAAKLLVDFNPMVFEEMPPSAYARKW
ncbi:MAG: hypothetical protein KBB83_04345 [Alphaproteobacteria bacterium]|nr:hypothetical protein [Alphaproteobacteria bacterium]